LIVLVLARIGGLKLQSLAPDAKEMETSKTNLRILPTKKSYQPVEGVLKGQQLRSDR